MTIQARRAGPNGDTRRLLEGMGKQATPRAELKAACDVTRGVQAQRILAALTVGVLMVVGGLVAGSAIRQLRAESPLPTSSAVPGGAALSAPALSSAAPSCADLQRLSRITAPLQVSDSGNGSTRITSAEGGYSITVPSDWTVTPAMGGQSAFGFGQVQASSYDPAKRPPMNPETWMWPPELGISLSVQVWVNPRREPLEQYVQHVYIGENVGIIPGGNTTIDGRDAYRFTVKDEHRFGRADGTLVVSRQAHLVWLIQSMRPDRLIVAIATPGESSLAPTVEGIVAGMKLTAPVQLQRPLLQTRDEVLAQWLVGKNGSPIPGRRAEAKLVTYLEAGSAFNPTGGAGPSGIYRVDHDPDDLYWLVAVSGPDLPEGRRGPMMPAGSATAPPTQWIMSYRSATEDNAPGGGQSSTQGTWPSTFDALPDRCR